MSRIRIRNLTTLVTEDRLYCLISPAGEITDVRVMRTDNGESRKFAYIGFRTEQAAQEAIRRFNGFQFDDRRIICEIASPIGGPSSSQAERQCRAESGRLFVRNLPYKTSEQELEEAFSKFGEVLEVLIPVDKRTGRSRGFAFIQYALSDSASRAIGELNYSTFQGRVMQVKEASPIPAYKKQDDWTANRAPRTFKRQRKEPEASGDKSLNPIQWPPKHD